MGWRFILLLLIAIGVTSAAAEAARPGRRGGSQSAPSDGLREVVTDEYIIRTDLPERDLPPILGRLRAMAGEYRKRTRELSDLVDDRRLPFYLYADLAAYTQAGGAEGSAGTYDGEKLLAFVGDRLDARAWHTIQHEAFHQYLGAKLGFEIPIWLNEGLAEYFGESLYTGDGFVSGLVPPWRLKRIRADMARFPSLRGMLEMSHQEWNDALNQGNYDMAWSLVQFLAHGEDGRYQEGLTRYIEESAKGVDPLRAFEDTVGDLPAIEAAWVSYWRDLPDEPIRVAWADAAVKTVCSYLGRAAAMRCKPGDADELLSLARAGELPQPSDDQLPIDLLLECLTWSRDLGEWKFDHNQRAESNVTLRLKDGTLVQGAYSSRPGRFQQLHTWVASPQTSPAARRPGRR